MNWKVRPLLETEFADYDELARRHGTLFNCTDWLALFGERVCPRGIFNGGGALIGGAAFQEERRWGLRIIRNPPFTPTCGPFMAVKSRNPVAVLEERRKLLECFAEQLDKEPAAISSLALDRGISDALPFFWRGFKVIPNYTYLLDLDVSLDDMRKNMSPVRRNDASKATRDGLMVTRTTDMSIVRDLVLATFVRQQKLIDEPILEAILFRYAKPFNSYAFTTCCGDVPAATCFVVHDAKTAYYLLGGYNAQERHHGAGPLAVLEAIKHAQELGLKTFDFEGSVVPAIERYFRGFGGQLTPYFTVNKAWLPLEMALKVVRRQIF
jgi:hypothetical protein